MSEANGEREKKRKKKLENTFKSDEHAYTRIRKILIRIQ